MIASITGIVEAIEGQAAVVNVNGVGYLLHCPAPVAAELRKGTETRLHTELVAREDSLTLYAFATTAQREAFRLVTQVTGIGPKLGLSILSHMDPDSLSRAIASSDTALLTSVPGVGKRGAQRMVLELKEKLGLGAVVEDGSPAGQAREALIGLGYTASEVSGALGKIRNEEGSVEEMVKAALRELAPA